MSFRKWLKIGLPALEKRRFRQEPLEKQFESIVTDYLQPGHLVLDAGCGITTYANVRGKCRLLVGVDADTGVTRNRWIDALVHADLSHLPFPDNTFEVVISWTVLEHIEDPQACFRELARVCKSGGLMVHSTPNMLHYANFFIRFTPYWFHKWFIRHILGQNDFPYPARYKINTPHRLRKLMSETGFKPREFRLIDPGPIYLSWFSPAYALGLVYHRLVNRFKFLSYFRGFMIGVSIRQPEPKMSNDHG
jgi:ubiquinone/menaquinone biosynthesis C-methylase UbiE